MSDQDAAGVSANDPAGSSGLDPAGLSVLIAKLSGVADEMGAVLRRGAFSPNIKERADCSAAVFGPGGEMLAQAEHIPVHLGSMPASVAAVIDAGEDDSPKRRLDCRPPLRVADCVLPVALEELAKGRHRCLPGSVSR